VLFREGGSVTRVMVSTQRATPRVVVTMRVAIDGATPEEASRLSVGEIEEIARGVRELADGYERLARERAAGRQS
jgi:hypothetical protein